MSLTFYVGDYGPVPAAVTEEDGVTPATPIEATATVVNLHTGSAIVSDAVCYIEPGTAAYIIPDESPITATAARYVAYISVTIDATTRQTVAVPFDVLDKSSNLIVDRWRRKVEFAAPNLEAISDQEGRDWIDQAVSHLNGHYFDTGYTSVLASLTPSTGVEAAGPNEIELFASVAALMARTAWWAGKGNWRDEEMSLDTSPFWREWSDLKDIISASAVVDWYSGVSDPLEQHNMYNRDKIDIYGFPNEPDNYHNASWWGDN
jgi:hypothetical protein